MAPFLVAALVRPGPVVCGGAVLGVAPPQIAAYDQNIRSMQWGVLGWTGAVLLRPRRRGWTP